MRYGGNTSCVEVRVGDELYIFDCGTGFRALGQALRHEFDGDRDLRSRFRLPFSLGPHSGHSLSSARFTTNRENRFHFHSSSRTRSLKRVLEEQMAAPYFPVGLTEMQAQPEFLRI